MWDLGLVIFGVHLLLLGYLFYKSVHFPKLLGVLLIIVGAQVYGVLGMVFAIPMFFVYRTILSETYKELVKIYK